MALDRMQPIKRDGWGESQFNYEYRVDLSAGETSNWIVIPDNVYMVYGSVYITSGSGEVEESNDLYDNLESTTLKNKWNNGIVTSNQNFELKPVKAFRFVCYTGSLIGTATAR